MKNITPLQSVIYEYEKQIGTPFKPTPELFYRNVNINQKRFGQLLRGEKEPVISELKSLAAFFKVSVICLI